MTLAKFDTTLTSHLGFPDPNYFICLLFTLSVPSEDYCINAYMMWGFWCDCSFCWYRKNCWPSQFTFGFHYYQSLNKKKYWTCIIMLCKLQHGMQLGTWYFQTIKAMEAIECAWLDWCNLILVQILTKYKIPTKYYVNIRPKKHSENPKSKAKYSRATNTKTKGDNIYRKLKFER